MTFFFPLSLLVGSSFPLICVMRLLNSEFNWLNFSTTSLLGFSTVGLVYASPNCSSSERVCALFVDVFRYLGFLNLPSFPIISF
ncbi:hypothetical protein C1646_694962 [Rhizophagus diaphanus]|nr:hypothetical protein C1646_694962 [Rhizophagus diaphanus] [Rhizophagus sp. MUCL 43196]